MKITNVSEINDIKKYDSRLINNNHLESSFC